VTITLDLPQELEHKLTEEAEQLGLSLPEYALRVLAASGLAGMMPRTGAELVAYWQREGVIGSRPEISDSPAHARRIRATAQQRQRS
jgi:hypothetical protein